VAYSTLGPEIFGPDQAVAIEDVEGVYERLLTIDANGKLAPQLAEKWESSPDGKNWAFFLRKGVQFHNGYGEFTADDVKFSVEQGSIKGSLNPTYTTLAQKLDNIEIVNPYQVTFHFKEPYVVMAGEASTPRGRAVMVSKKYYAAVGKDKADQNPVGTGPFKYVDHKIGESITLEAVEGQWRVTPGFKNVIYKLVPTTATTLQMLKSGDVDIASVGAANTDELQAAGLRIEQSPNASSFYIGLGGQIPPAAYPKQFDPTIPWVGDPTNPASLQNAYKVRYALALGIDREAILRNIFKGAGALYSVPLYEASDAWTDPAWKPIPYDPAKAKSLLAEAGYANGIELSLWTYPQSGRTELSAVGEAIAMQWQQIGVKTNLKPSDFTTVTPTLVARSLGKAAIMDAVPKVDVEPLSIYSTYFYSKSSWYYGIEDPRLDSFQDKIMAEGDPIKRAALEKQRGQLLIDNSWILPVVSKNLLWAVGKSVGQWKPLPVGQNFRNGEYAVPAK
jgi:peptide/nickel transport system substrate-binding protein